MARKIRNANGEGSICFDESRNKYRASIVDPSGKRIQKRFSTKREAGEWLTLIKAEVFKDEYIPRSNVTIGEWVIEYLHTYSAPNVRPKTLIRYMQTAKKLEPIAHLSLQEANAHSIQKFYNKLQDVSDSSKLKIHKLLKATFTKAHNLGIIKKNIMLNVDAPKYEPQEVEIFTTDEIKKLLDSIADSEYYRKYLPLFTLAVTTGARLGEILGLKRNSVYHGYVKIENSLQEVKGELVDMPPKTKAGNRTVTISPKLANALRNINQGTIIPFDGYVFHTKFGTPISPTNFQRTWLRILKEAGLPRKRFHALRHTHATQLLAAGIPLLEVSKRLGHSDTTHTLRLYGHAIPGYDTQIPEKVNQIFSIK